MLLGAKHSLCVVSVFSGTLSGRADLSLELADNGIYYGHLLDQFSPRTVRYYYLTPLNDSNTQLHRVKSSMFGQTAKFGQRSCLFYTSIIGIK